MRSPPIVPETLLKIFLAIVTFVSTSVLAQTPYLVKDINTTVAQNPSSSGPSNFQVFGDAVYFGASTPEAGYELYKYSNGTAQLVADVTPGPGDSYPGQVYDIGGGQLLFFAYRNNVLQLWRTDGTAAGTASINSANGAGDIAASYKNRLYFTGYDNVHGGEPWVSDGTAAGTQLFADLNPGAPSSYCGAITVLGDKLLFFATGSLWTSDGTAAGTTNIATVGRITALMNTGTRIFFAANLTGYGNELWVSDGTAAGTQMLADIAPGSGSGLNEYHSPMVAIGDTVYFTAAADMAGYDLWKTDGTPAGTQFVTVLSESSYEPPGYFAAAGPLFCFGKGNQLFRSDGTAAGTYAIDSSLTSYGYRSAFGKVFYSRDAGNGDVSLMSTDGNTTTTIRTSRSFNPYGFVAAGGKLYFSAFDVLSGYEPWVSDDGTAAMTRQLVNVAADMPPSSNPNQLTVAGNKVFFFGNETWSPELWTSDGTADGTIRLGTAASGSLAGSQSNLYFDAASGIGLWRSDGTVEGTTLVKQVSPFWKFGSASYLYLSLTQDYSHLLFRTDGTDAGTIALADGSDVSPVDPAGMTEFAGRVYVKAGTPRALWVSEGTPQTTKRLLTNANLEYYSPRPEGAAGGVFFAGLDGAHGVELWRTDGRVGGEAMVKDIAAGPNSSAPVQLTRAGALLYFVANDGVHGTELWRSDGTEAGTIELNDIFPGAAASNPTDLTAGSRLLYFVANDGLHGRELWQSDGTPAGTTLVADLKPGAGDSGTSYLRFANGRLWFAADDGLSGTELWSVVEGGTPSLVADLAPGSASSYPSEMVQAGNLLYFAATTMTTGRELWALSLDNPVISIADTRVIEGTGSTTTAHFLVTRSGPTTSSASVSYTTSDVTATGGSDYTAATGTITFAPGETTKNIDIAITGDAVAEGDETFIVTLSSPVSAVVDRSVATGIIQDDDHRVALSIALLPNPDGWGAPRRYRITNAGPSTATELRVKYSESPGDVYPSLNYRFPAGNGGMWLLDPLPAGSSVDVDVRSNANPSYVDPANRPGHTITANVWSAEAEDDLSDNITSAMADDTGNLVFPPWLIAGTTATATYSIFANRGYPVDVTLTPNDGNVVVSPSTITIPNGQLSGTFNLNVGNGTGPVRFAISSPNLGSGNVVVPVVAPGVTPKLDVAIVAPGSPFATYGNPITIPVRIGARRHDGTLPTGTVTLLDWLSGSVVAEQTLDATASTTFTFTDMPAGYYKYTIRYNGDGNFNPLGGAFVNFYLHGITTTLTSPQLPLMICAGTPMSIPITLTAYYVDVTPPGSVSVTVGSDVYNLPLTAGPTGGTAVATFNHTFAAGDSRISLSYPGSGAYEPAYVELPIFVQSCQSMGLVATAVGQNVNVTWNAVTGADHYEVYWASGPGGWTVFATTFVPNFSHTYSVSQPVSYLYSVRAVGAANNTIAFANPDLATVPPFTDDLVPGVTTVRAMHFGQLSGAADALWRLATGQPTFFSPWPTQLPITASGFGELRNRIVTYRQMIGLPPFAFSAPPVTDGVIRASDFQELRDAVK